MVQDASDYKLSIMKKKRTMFSAIDEFDQNRVS